MPRLPGVASVGAVLHAVGCLSCLVRMGVMGSGWVWQREEAGEDGLDVGGPGPVGWEVQPALSAASGEDGWGVEDLVLQGFGFGAGEVACAGEELQPGGEVAGDGLGAVPGGVDGELLGGQAFRAGGVAVFEVVLDSGVDPVAAVEPGGDLLRGLIIGWGDVVVGGERFVAPSRGAYLQVEFELVDAGQGLGGGLAQWFDAADEHP